jgi:signal transduction histidine kinase
LGYAEGDLKALVARAVRSPDMPEEKDLYVVEEPTPRFVERTVRPVSDEFNNTIGLLLVFRDVTEQRELEEARENLANMIVHDLRNPLTAVLASLALVNSTVVERDETGVAKQATDVSARAVRKLLVMVNNLLDLGRLEAGEIVPEQKPTAVSEFVQNAVGEMLPLAMEMEVTMTVDSAGLDALPRVSVDPDMIERVALNLLDNALKFSPPGSGVTLKAELLDEDEEDEDEEPRMVQVAVIDSGPGIPEEDRTRIFERYQQVRGQQGRRRGTGLGLAFCRMAVEAHGGRIWIEDAPEGGSAFKFTLPVVDDSVPFLD